MSKIQIGYLHEVLDRLHVLMSNIDDHLLDHPGVTPQIKGMIQNGQAQLMAAYQETGREMDILEERESKP